jgi:hypothetical protein
MTNQRRLLLPHITSLSDLVEDVRLLKTPTGVLYRDQAEALVGGRCFVSCLYSNLARFGTMGGKRDYRTLSTGERIKRHSGGYCFGTYVRPSAVLAKAFAGYIGGKIGGLELVTRHDGETLVIATDNDSGMFSAWITLLPPGAASMVALMPECDQQLIEADQKASALAWGEQ